MIFVSRRARNCCAAGEMVAFEAIAPWNDMADHCIAPPMQSDIPERRRHERREVQLPALAVLNDGVRRLDATIVDMSISGARIALDEPADVPDQFYLLMPKHRLQPCRVVWRSAQFLGVSYSE
jgi:hypothetical protein